MISQSSTRITRNNLTAMKQKANVNAFVLLKRMADATFSETASFLNEFSKPGSAKDETCKYNGHVLNSPMVGLNRPKCAECGCEITSLQDIRIASIHKITSDNSEDKPIEFFIDQSLKARRLDLMPRSV